MLTASVVLYANEASHHLCDLLDALAAREDVGSVTLVTETGVTKERVELGWAQDVTGRFNHIVAPGDTDVRRLVEASPVDCMHIFVGMRHLRCVNAGIAACVALDRRFALMHETRVREGVGGWLRYIQSWLTEGRIRRKGLVLAIGALGVDWFLSTGYAPERVFPFAYFIAERGGDQPVREASGPIRIGYVGRLEAVKGFDDLLAALPLIAHPYELRVVGKGQGTEACRDLAVRDGRVACLGVLPFDAVQAHMRDIDILIQPSRTSNDGWAVVVSEALINGAAVVTSDVVGASACLKAPWRGRVVGVKRPDQIAAAINALADEALLTQAARIERAAWARRLTAVHGADYLMRILDHAYGVGPRPESFLD